MRDCLFYHITITQFIEWHSILYVINYELNYKPEELLYNYNNEPYLNTLKSNDDLRFQRQEILNKEMYKRVFVSSVIIFSLISVAHYLNLHG